MSVKVKQILQNIPVRSSSSSSCSFDLDNDDAEDLQSEIYECCHLAIQMKNVSMFENFYQEINKNEIYSSRLFYKACDVGCIDIMAILIRHGTSIHSFSPDVSEEFHSSLLFAVEKGNTNVVKFLCSFSAVAKDVSNKYGMTAIMLATKAENSACLDILIKSGCDVNFQDLSGNTVLHHLCYALIRSHKALQCLKMLIKAGCDIDKENKFGETAFQVALVRQHYQIMQALVLENCYVSANDFRLIPCFKNMFTGTSFSIVRQGSLYHFDGVTWRFKGAVKQDNSSLPSKSKLPVAFESLKDACRFEIRRHLGTGISTKIEQLHIPYIIKDFILLKDVLLDQCNA